MSDASRRLWSPVTRTIWSDTRFLALSPAPPSAQTLWLYLLTGPDQGQIPGLFVSGVGTLTDRLQTVHPGWSYDLVRSHLAELRDAGMLRMSARPPLLWMPNAAKHRNAPNSAQVIGWRRAYVELPECDLRTEAMLLLRRWMGDTARATFDETFPELLGGCATPSPTPSPTGSTTGSTRGSGGPSRVGRESPPVRERESESELIPAPTPDGAGGTPERLAALLREGIATHLPVHAERRVKARHVATWATDIGRILRLDGYSPGLVERLIRLVHHEGHPSVVFWRPNILSGKKLREKFPQVLGQARAAGAVDAAVNGSSKPWHRQHSKHLRRLRDYLSGAGVPLSAAALVEHSPSDLKPTPKQAAAAAQWLQERQ